MKDPVLTLESFVSGRIFANHEWTGFHDKLTEDDIQELTVLFCKGCRQDTKDAFEANLRQLGRHSYNDGIYRRVSKENYGWQLTAGQDYNVDRKAVRDAVLKG